MLADVQKLCHCNNSSKMLCCCIASEIWGLTLTFHWCMTEKVMADFYCYLIIGAGRTAVQLLVHSVQSLQEGGLGSSDGVLRNAVGGHQLFPQHFWRSLNNR